MTNNLTVDTKIYYTGDQANCPSYGVITATHERTKYSPESVDIEYDDERFDGDEKKGRKIPISAFSSGPGCRFMVVCPICTKRADQPLRSHMNDDILQGCVNECHGPYLTKGTKSYDWHHRADAVKIRKAQNTPGNSHSVKKVAKTLTTIAQEINNLLPVRKGKTSLASISRQYQYIITIND